MCEWRKRPPSTPRILSVLLGCATTRRNFSLNVRPRRRSGSRVTSRCQPWSALMRSPRCSLELPEFRSSSSRRRNPSVCSTWRTRSASVTSARRTPLRPCAALSDVPVPASRTRSVRQVRSFLLARRVLVRPSSPRRSPSSSLATRTPSSPST